MITLGINAAFHDSAAALVRDGRLVAAAEEERFTRIKHGKRPVPFSTWELPYHAIDYCLAEAGVTLAEVDHVAYSYDPQRFIRDRVKGDTLSLPMQPSAGEAGAWESVWDPLFASYIVNAPRQLADGAPHHLKKRFAAVPLALRRSPPVAPGKRLSRSAFRAMRGHDARRPRRGGDHDLRPVP